MQANQFLWSSMRLTLKFLNQNLSHQQFIYFQITKNTIITSSSAMAATSVYASPILGSWGTSVAGEENVLLQAKAAPAGLRVTRPVRGRPMMKNVNEGKGVFAPIVVVARDIIGKKRFNQLRGKAIALHSQVITEFCKSIGADSKQRQGLIRLAKKNGEWLGFLA